MKKLQELLDLSGKVAIVTGGAMGIGLGISRRLAEAGASVLVADADFEAASGAAKQICEEGYSAEAVGTDVQYEDDVTTAVETAKQLGELTILVNNAGIYPNLPLANLEPAQFDRILAVNLRGVYLFTKYVSEEMKAGGVKGNIVNVTSIDALHPSMVGLASYDASKHGVWGLTKASALELAAYGIRVNAVAPGGIQTPGVAALNAGNGKSTGTQALTDAFLAKIPMHRMGDPDEIAKVVLFLVSDMASYMTGSQIVVDGGVLLA